MKITKDTLKYYVNKFSNDLKENQLQIWLHNNIKVYTRRFTTKLIN